MRLGEDICGVATLQHLRVLGVGCFGGPCMKLSVYISCCNKAPTAHSELSNLLSYKIPIFAYTTGEV